MATKSFLKNVNIKSAKQARNLISALEKAENFHGEEVKLSRAVQEVQRSEIKNFSAKMRFK